MPLIGGRSSATGVINDGVKHELHAFVLKAEPQRTGTIVFAMTALRSAFCFKVSSSEISFPSRYSAITASSFSAIFR
jgi:hypothetical protein